MKTVQLIAALVVMLAVPTSAQDDYPRGEFFGGFSWANWDRRFGDREKLFGYQFSFTANLHRNVGATFDHGGHWGSRNAQHHEFLLGPRLTGHGKRVSAFLHALAGFTLFRRGSTGFSLGLGGGFDLNASDVVALRVLQVDYVPTRSSSRWSHDIRLGAGLAFKIARDSNRGSSSE